MSAATSSHSASSYFARVVTSTAGAKVVMAISGLLFYGWLILHLLGNLTIFAGAETMNAYAHFLAGNAELLWAQRIGWFVVLVVHILSGLRLARMNRAARPERYAGPRKWRQASLASRSMAVSGIVVVAFVIFHLLHFTGGVVLPQFFPPAPAAGVPADVHSMVTQSFRLWWVVLIYVIGLSLLGLHLSHGVWSATQTMGLNGRKWTPFAKVLGLVLGLGLVLAFILIPIATLAGLAG